jgi:hypothetical protein
MDDLILKMAIWQDTLSVKYEQTGDWLVWGKWLQGKQKHMKI